MAKPGLTILNCGNCLPNAARNNGWALCVGAGASVPIFPQWGEFVSKVLQRFKKKQPVSVADFEALRSAFSLDALLQATHGELGCGDYQFAQVLAHHLYANLKGVCSTAEWHLVVKFLGSKACHNFPEDECAKFLAVFHSKYGGCTAVQLMEAIGHSLVEKVAPVAIVSFNAEPLLQTLCAAYVSANTALPRESYFDTCIRGIAPRHAGRVGVYYCHGLLPRPGESIRKSQTSLDKLVFSETEYLALVGSTFSWQSALFLNAAMAHRMVFVGVSFSDPNLRRWLGFVHSNRLKELRALGATVKDSTNHFWIKTAPASAAERVWTERVVAHLGVRLVWIDHWGQVKEALEKMLCIG